MGTALRAENVSIRYITGDFKDIGIKEYAVRRLTNNYHVKEFMAVDGVSFQLENGDMLGIIGSNGAGKSTLLKAIAGIMEPTQGKITAQGEIAALLELGSGFDGDLTVRENAYLRGAMLGYTREFMDQTYDQIIDFAELREFGDRPFKQLSSGMKSRLAFSIASLVNPDILILDEVLSVGDGAFQEKSAKKMKEIISQGTTTILVSHSLSQIRELCNKVLWLDHGRQVAFGETAEICDRYERFLRGEYSIEINYEGALEKQKAVDAVEARCRDYSWGEEKAKSRISVKRVGVKKYLLYFFAVLYIGLVACLLVENRYIQNNKKVTIVPQNENVPFRGASVDGNWYNPQDIVVSSNNWLFREEDYTLISTATGSDALELSLPIGMERMLIFNVGPDGGKIDVFVEKNVLEWNLYSEESAEFGTAFKLPYVRFSNKAKLNFAAMCLLIALAGMMLVVNLYFRVKNYNPDKRTEVGVKNSAIEFLRFFIIMCVVVHHYCGLTPSGNLGVDFFFLLSGFLLMRHYVNNFSVDEEPILGAVRYTKMRYMRLIPYYMLVHCKS